MENPCYSLETNLKALSGSLVLKHLKYCQHTTIEHSGNCFKLFFDDWLASFDLAKDGAHSNQSFVELSAIQRGVNNRSLEVRALFCELLREGFVKFQSGTLNTTIDANKENAPKELGLLDDYTLEENISIASICQRMDSEFSELIWMANKRLAILNRGVKVIDESNPFAPIQFCNALRLTLSSLKVDIEHRRAAYKLFETHLITLQRNVLQENNDYLAEQGILSTLKYQSKVVNKSLSDKEITEPVTSRDSVTLDDHHISSQQAHESELMQSVRSLMHEVSPNYSASYMDGQIDDLSHVRYASSSNVVDALNAVQKIELNIQLGAQAQNFNKPLDVKGVSHKILEQLKVHNNGNAVAKDDRYIIDVVGMLFEYMLNDENLPDNVKALLSHLHTPFLKIAFLDPDFFEHSEHPVRLLLNALTEAGSRWLDKDGKPSLELFNTLKDVVRSVLETNEDEVKTVTALLLKFRTDTKKVVRKQELMEKRAKEKAAGESRLRTVKLRVRSEIKTMTSDVNLPSPVLLFLLKAWTDYMCFILLRQGDKSDAWTGALALVKNLVWVVSVKTNEEDRLRQKKMSGSIILYARKGLETISFEKDSTDSFIAALTSAINEVVLKEKVNLVSKEEREKFEAQADEKAGLSVSLQDKPTPIELDVIDKLKLMECGSWVEFVGGRRLKVSWCDDGKNDYLFVNPMGQRDQMLSALEFARLMISKKVKIIYGSAKPFFERALENMLKRLNEEQKKSGSDIKQSEHALMNA